MLTTLHHHDLCRARRGRGYAEFERRILFSEFTVAPLWTIPMDITPKFSGSASGLMNIVSPLAAITSPLILGYLIDKTGSWNYPFVGSIFVLLCGTIVAFWMKPEQELHPQT